MPIPIIITLAVSLTLFVAMIIFMIVLIRKRSKSCVYTVKGKQVVVSVSMRRGAQLFVNGGLEDQFSSQVSRFTLRATIDGEEFKAHITIGMSVTIEAYYHGTLLTPDSIGK